MGHRIVIVIVAVAAPWAGPAAAQTPETQPQEQAVLLSGAVTMSDNSAPPTAVVVRRICHSHIDAETLTDAQGHYSFKVDGGQGEISSGDATQAAGRPADLNRPFGNAIQYSNPVTSALRDCEISAILAGYRSDPVRLAVRSTMDDTRVATIVLFPLSRADALTVSVTTETAPKNARKAHDKAVAAIKAQDWDTAARELTRAVKAYPKFAVAWFELGLARERQGAVAAAVQAWQQAVNADARYLLPYERLATYADRNGQWEDAARYSGAWIRLDPEDFPAAYLVNAIAAARLLHLDEAERAARAGLAIDKSHRMPRLNYVLGLIMAEKHDYAASAEQFREYLKYAPDAKDAETVREQVARFERSATKQ